MITPQSLLLFLAFLGSQQESQDPPRAPAAVASQVTVPSFPNATCPIMGKPISTKLYTDTEYGRIYICCKSCVREIRADLGLAYKTAYPSTLVIWNTTCPLTGKPIVKDSPRVELQGREFSVLCAKCVPRAREDAQTVLARLDDPSLVDVGNQTCPITGKPVSKNALAVVDGQIVRLLSPAQVEDVKKDPAKSLEHAIAIRKKQDAARAAERDGQAGRG